MIRTHGWFSFLVIAMATLSTDGHADDMLVYVSAFASGEHGAIHVYRLDGMTGTLALVARNHQHVEQPFYLALSPNRSHLYAIHTQDFGGERNDDVAAYEIQDVNGRLRFLNLQSTHGRAACYLNVDQTGRMLMIASYTTGNVACLPIARDGSLQPATSVIGHVDTARPADDSLTAHAHCIVSSPDHQLAFAADLGIDQLRCYRIDAAQCSLTPHTLPFVRSAPGAGPRHLVFHPNAQRAYVINELNNTVTSYEFVAARGQLIERHTARTLPPSFSGKSNTADVQVSPDGRFLYGTNRGHDSIVVLRLDADGNMSFVAHEASRGGGPQNLAITPDGRWLICANMPGNNVAVFSIDSQTGRLSLADTPTEVPSPSCVLLH